MDGLQGQRARRLGRQALGLGGGLHRFGQQEDIGRPAARKGGHRVHQGLVLDPAGEAGGGEQLLRQRALPHGGVRPLDLPVYKKGGKDFLLMSNSKHGVLKISTDGFASATPITARVGGTAGVPFETVASMVNVEQMDLLNATHSILIVKGAAGRNLTTVVLP